MEERMRFMLAVAAQEEPMAALCRRFGVSRRIGYKWLGRYHAEGVAGLMDRSRAPLRHPRAVVPELLEPCLDVRRAHPTWGPAKVRAWLERREPARRWPAASTIGALFDREGLTVKRRLRRRAPPGPPPFDAGAANDVWTIDFKGWFLTGDGTRVDPLTLRDACSRYLLRCQAVARCDTEHVWPILDAAFREHGLPLRLRSDVEPEVRLRRNGAPFATTGAGGLSRLAVLVIKAGITPERITPGQPQENAGHERLHLTLLQDTADPPAATLRAQQQRFGSFRTVYNEERPHAALGNQTPAECYAPSPRAWDGVLRSPGTTDAEEVRRVRRKGEIKWRGSRVHINAALAGEPIGLVETDDGRWAVRYGPVLLGFIDHRGDRLTRPRNRADGLVDNALRCPQGPQPPQPPPPRT
jgi:transposase InsO family protein